jgi:glutamine synthetase
MAVVDGAEAARIEELQASGVRFVRLLYSDLHGVARGKVIPIAGFERVVEDGIAFVAAVMTIDLRHNIVSGPESGFQDILARPDLSTLVRLPWDPQVAWCLADLGQIASDQPHTIDPRGALRAVTRAYEAANLTPVLGPELEFYLCEPDDTDPRGFCRYGKHDSHVYTVGFNADPRGILERMLQTCVDLGLGALAANQEYGRGQYEININHGPALASADRAFMFKTAIKELAARDGLLATFMGKPWNDDEGSGFHLHVSLGNEQTPNLFHDPNGESGLSDLLRHFVAGVLAHAPALMGFLNPTVNAYRRIKPDALVPTCVNWGHDNRFTFIRIPRERGMATRVEVRVGDGAANPYLAYAAILTAGLDGIERKLDPPEPLTGLIYRLPEEERGAPLPTSLDQSLEALESDQLLRDALGAELIDTFAAIKRYELARYRDWVSDWEFREYSHHL